MWRYVFRAKPNFQLSVWCGGKRTRLEKVIHPLKGLANSNSGEALRILSIAQDSQNSPHSMSEREAVLIVIFWGVKYDIHIRRK